MIPGYEVIQELAHNDWQTLYRGRRLEDLHPVLLKLSRRHPPTANDLEMLESEYALLRELTVAGTPRALELIRHDGGYCLVLEDEGAMPLYILRPCGLDEFFKLALSLTSMLVDLHRRDRPPKHQSAKHLIASGDGRHLPHRFQPRGILRKRTAGADTSAAVAPHAGIYIPGANRKD